MTRNDLLSPSHNDLIVRERNAARQRGSTMTSTVSPDPATVAGLLERLNKRRTREENMASSYQGGPEYWWREEAQLSKEAAEKLATFKEERDRYKAALEKIRLGDTTTFDDDLQTDVEVAMDVEDLQAIADAALQEPRP